MRHARQLAAAGALAGTLLPSLAHAASGSEAASSHPLTVVLALAALSLVPFAVLMLTCFARIAVVLSILRSAIGSPHVPPTQVLTGLALVLTIFVMAPTGQRMARAAEPVLGKTLASAAARAGSVETVVAAADRAKEPLREFLIKHGDPRERAMFHALAAKARTPEERAGLSERDLLVVVPAFVTSELRRAFEIGFLLFVPFLVVDLVIANLLLALGMNALSPAAVALPFKLLLFVLADGWHLVIRGLVESYT